MSASQSTVTSRPLPALLVMVISSALWFGLPMLEGVLYRQHRSLGVIPVDLRSLMSLITLWCILILPWSVLVIGAYWVKKETRYRTVVLLIPAILMALCAGKGLIEYPPTAASIFEKHSAVSFPKNAQNVQWGHMPSGAGDGGVVFAFDTTPEESRRLIEQLDLKPNFGKPKIEPLPGIAQINGSVFSTHSETEREIHLIVGEGSPRMYVQFRW